MQVLYHSQTSELTPARHWITGRAEIELFGRYQADIKVRVAFEGSEQHTSRAISLGGVMDANFWLKRWEGNEIGFHQSEFNALMVDNFHSLSLAKESRIFVPLCGKTRDIAWLLSQGYSVVGAELSNLAVEQLFADLGVEPEISAAGKLQHFKSENIDIFVGDIFNLSADTIGAVDAVYDRAALVAFPADLRGEYASCVNEITKTAPQLLICFEYDQTLVQGPPFSVDQNELDRVYGEHYDPTQLASISLDDGLKGKWPAKETVWLLRKRITGTRRG